MNEHKVVSDTKQHLRTEYHILNGPALKKLIGRFTSNAWIELHSCQVADEEGVKLLKELAKLLRVRIPGSRDKQFPGGGLEGRFIVAHPSGRIEYRIPRPKPKPKREKNPWWKIRCNMATNGSLHGRAMTRRISEHGVTRSRQPILG